MPGLGMLLILGLLVVPALYYLWDYHGRKRLLHKLKAGWGKEEALRRMDADEMADVAHYAAALHQLEPPSSRVDDTTWSDLDMDDVLRGIDASMSVVGSETLYSMLRDQGCDEATIDRRLALAEAFEADQALRLKAQTALFGIGRHAFHGAWRYLFQASFQYPQYPWIYPILSVMPVLLALLGLVHQLFLLLAAAAFALNLAVQLRTQAVWQKEVTAIRHIGAVIKCAQALTKVKQPGFDAWRQRIAAHQGKLRAIRFWLPFFGVEAAGDMSIVMEYLKILFLPDMLSLVAIVRIINRHNQAVRGLYALVGEVDACLSIAQLQQRVQGLCRPRFHGDRQLVASGIRHPLLVKAVANDVRWQRNCLISGSNASGKSTFIKAIAVNIILAQSLGLCHADRFALRRGLVMSAMAVRDNIGAGESYFIVEIKSLKRILDQVDQRMVYCFIDEILRGTNTIERIAASSAVLERLARKDSLCMVATHDIELTRILAQDYEMLHFSEVVDDAGIHFDYLVKPGPSRTRNAILLLKQMGYPVQLVERAQQTAQYFEESGAWPSQQHAAGDTIPNEARCACADRLVNGKEDEPCT